MSLPNWCYSGIARAVQYYYTAGVCDALRGGTPFPGQEWTEPQVALYMDGWNSVRGGEDQ